MSQQGHVYQRVKGRGRPWSIRWRAPDGKHRSKGGFRTKGEAVDKLNSILDDTRDGSYVERNDMTMTEFLRSFLGRNKTELAPTTWRRYEGLIRTHVEPEIGNVKVQDLTPGAADAVFVKMRHDKKLSAASTRQCRAVLHKAFEQARKKDRLVATNSIAYTDAPKPDRDPKDVTVLEPLLVRRLLTELRGTEWFPIVLFAVSTGCRRGECLGLRWQDVNLEAREATIRQTIQQLGHRPVLKDSTKTGRSRKVALPAEVVDVLRTWRWLQGELSAYVPQDDAWAGGDLVFTRPDGSPLRPNSVSQAVSRVLDDLGRPDASFHSLRHSFASAAIAEGGDPASVCALLGHKNPNVTLGVYTHAFEKVKTDVAAQATNALLGDSVRGLFAVDAESGAEVIELPTGQAS